MTKIFESKQGWIYTIKGEDISKVYKDGVELINDAISKGNIIEITLANIKSSKTTLKSVDDLKSFKKEFYGELLSTEFICS